MFHFRVLLIYIGNFVTDFLQVIDKKEIMMKKFFYCIFFLFLVLQTTIAQSDSTAFRCKLLNNEFKVYMHIDLLRQQIEVPGQEIYGPLPGYVGKERYTFVWPIVSATVKGKTATLTLVNDYGSEDLTASLTRENDSIYVLKQLEGNTLKLPHNGKWLKLPRTVKFKRQEKSE